MTPGTIALAHVQPLLGDLCDLHGAPPGIRLRTIFDQRVARSSMACFRARSDAGRALATPVRAPTFITGSVIDSTMASARAGSFTASLAANDPRML